MVKIPRHEASLTPQTVATIKEDPSQYTGAAQSMGTLGKNLKIIGAKVGQMQDLKEFTEASTEFDTKVLDIKKRMKTDTNYDNMVGVYSIELDEIQSRAMEKISKPSVRAKWALQASSSKDRLLLDAYSVAQVGKAKETQASLKTEIKVAEELLFEETNTERRAGLRDKIKKYYDAFIKADVIGSEEAEFELEERMESLTEREAQSDMDNRDPAKVWDELNKGSEGMYPNLTGEKRDKLKNDALKVVNRNVVVTKQKLEAKQISNQKEIGPRIRKREFDVTDVRGMILDGVVEPTWGGHAIAFINSYQGKDIITDRTTYTEVDAVISGLITKKDGKPYSQMEMVNLLMEKSGKLSDADYQELLKSIETEIDSRDNKMTNIAVEGIKSWFTNNMVAFKKPWEEIPEKDKADMYDAIYRFKKQVMDERASGDRIPEIQKDIIEIYKQDQNAKEDLKTINAAPTDEIRTVLVDGIALTWKKNKNGNWVMIK